MKVWGHTLVKNEGRWLWFSVTSVINHLDKLLIWDTGSTDDTVRIITELKKRYPEKIIFKKRIITKLQDFALARSEMLAETKSDWFMVLDGDEIWWEDSIKSVLSRIQGDNTIESVVTPTINLVGDIYHFQEQAAGNYNLAGRIGHYNLRFINRSIPGLASAGNHGTWGWVDGENKMIQDRDASKIVFVDAPYLHATNIERSSDVFGDTGVMKRPGKLKYDLGITFPLDYYYPESLFLWRPDFVKSPWKSRSKKFIIQSGLQTPLRKVKRRLWFKKVGY